MSFNKTLTFLRYLNISYLKRSFEQLDYNNFCVSNIWTKNRTYFKIKKTSTLYFRIELKKNEHVTKSTDKVIIKCAN